MLHEWKVCIKMCTHGSSRLWHRVSSYISCLSCAKCTTTRDKTRREMMPASKRGSTASTLELVDDNEDEHEDDSGDGDDSDEYSTKTCDNNGNLSGTDKHRKGRLKKAGKAVRVFVGKSLHAYSHAALVTPGCDLEYTTCHGNVSRYSHSRDFDYHSASYGVYL